MNGHRESLSSPRPAPVAAGGTATAVAPPPAVAPAGPPPPRVSSDAGAEDDGTPPPDDLPACLSCRKRKSRCSRETPSCSQCLRLGCECLYVSKQKPGLKAGVVDALSRRLDVLEKMFLDGTGNKKPHLAFLDLDIDQIRGQLTPFTPTHPAPAGCSGAESGSNPIDAPAQQQQQPSPPALHDSPTPLAARSPSRPPPTKTDDNNSGPRKRRRVETEESSGSATQYLFFDPPRFETDGEGGDDDADVDDDQDTDTDCSDNDDDAWISPLPALPLLEAAVEAHFQTVHHWVPILHPTRFRAKLKEVADFAGPQPRRGRRHRHRRQRREQNCRRRRHHRPLVILCHALLAMSLKYVDFTAFGLSAAQVERQIRLSRRAVQRNALDGLSFENTQALIFLAFDYMGSGMVDKAWPIVASLTRMVVFLQLTVEPDDEAHQRPPLLQSMTLFAKPRDWTESEERRRIFWAVFFLDRISSVSAGWHPSLTSNDVHRRLPCSGGFWAREESATTPYFVFWDEPPGAGAGKTIGVAPTSAFSGSAGAGTAVVHPSPRSDQFHHLQNNHHHHHHHNQTANSPGAASSAITNTNANANANGDAADANKLGAVAYCIEATEQLSHVHAFFLRQPAAFADRGEFAAWLTRFKELDLRLVHWKLHLPQQWSDWHVSLKIDPNLTLSHISHFASVILLHQHVAYPPAGWRELAGAARLLPSACSAEACRQAAADVAAISQKYLRYVGGLVNAQFAFCLFAAARFLLVHWRAGGTMAATATTTTTTMMTTAASEVAQTEEDDGGLARDFFALLENLDNISARWNGYCVRDEAEEEDEEGREDARGSAGGDADGSARTSLQAPGNTLGPHCGAAGHGTENRASRSALDKATASRHPRHLDLAAQYAARLRELHTWCINETTSTAEIVDLLSTPSLDGLIKKPAEGDSALPSLSSSAFPSAGQTPSSSSTSHSSYADSNVYSLSSFQRRNGNNLHNAGRRFRSPSINGGGVEMAGIHHSPVPHPGPGAGAGPGRGPISPSAAQVPMQPYGGGAPTRGGPIMATTSAVRMMPQEVVSPTSGGGGPSLHGNSPGGALLGMGMAGHQHQQQQPHHHPSMPPSHPGHPHMHPPPHPHAQQPQSSIDEDDEFAAMSHILMGNQFLDMDRVMIRNDASFLLRCE